MPDDIASIWGANWLRGTVAELHGISRVRETNNVDLRVRHGSCPPALLLQFYNQKSMILISDRRSMASNLLSN